MSRLSPTSASALSRPSAWRPHYISGVSSTLGKLGEDLPVVVASDYKRDAEGLRIASVVHVETVCAHPSEGWRYDEVGETRNVLDEAAGLGVPCHVVAYVDIKAPNAREVIAAHRSVAGATLVGVRNILNFDASDPSLTWPNITRGDYLKGAVPEFNAGCEGGGAGARSSRRLPRCMHRPPCVLQSGVARRRGPRAR